jgi:hypothetical protein
VHAHGREERISAANPASLGQIGFQRDHSTRRIGHAVEKLVRFSLRGVASWLMERPSPVPSPAGLVVKNGLKIFSLNSVGIPIPLSWIRIST